MIPTGNILQLWAHAGIGFQQEYTLDSHQSSQDAWGNWVSARPRVHVFSLEEETGAQREKSTQAQGENANLWHVKTSALKPNKNVHLHFQGVEWLCLHFWVTPYHLNSTAAMSFYVISLSVL